MTRRFKRFSTLILFVLICSVLLTTFFLPSAYALGSVKIAFIDTGISTKHIDPLQVAEGKNYIFPGLDTQDREGHGTSTAGMVLGSTKIGIEGSCPQAVAVPLVTYDRYPSGVAKIGDVSVMCEAIYEAIDFFECRVINISMGIVIDTEELRLAIEYAEEKGVVVVSALGNDNQNYPDREYYPALYPTVIGVGAAENTEEGFKVADFSNRKGVSVLAEGVGVKTVTNRNDSKPMIRNGTSFACSYVAGLCAQLLIESPTLTPAQVRAILFATAHDIDLPGVDLESGWGIVGIQRQNKETVSRGLMAALLYTYEGQQNTEKVYFADVLSGSYYEDAIFWAAAKSIVNGYGNGDFGPDNTLTREQFVTILYRYAKYKEMDVSVGEDTNILSYKDIDQLSEYAISAMQWACGSGLIQGYNGYIMPKGNLTREHIAIILLRFSQAVA